MINISDKDVRKELVSRYLDAGTTPDEERVLVDHYLNNDNVDSDELPFARLIRMEYADGNKKTYIMNRDKAMDTVSFMAIN